MDSKIRFVITSQALNERLRSLFDSYHFIELKILLTHNLGLTDTEAIEKLLLGGKLLVGDSSVGFRLETELESEAEERKITSSNSIKTFLLKNKMFFGSWKKGYIDESDVEDLPKDLKNLCTLLSDSFIGKNTVLEIFRKTLIKSLVEEGMNTDRESGCILRDGSLIFCEEQGHNALYESLYMVGEAGDENWTNDVQNVKFSSYCYMGSKIFDTLNPKFGIRKETEKITKNQLRTIFEQKDFISGIYSFQECTVTEMIRGFICWEEGKGSKYGNLQFLKEFYPEISYPKLEREIPVENRNRFLRSSPTESFPGLLNSYPFTTETEKAVGIIEMSKGWEEIKKNYDFSEKWGKDWALNFFEQEFIDGWNGVCNYTGGGQYDILVSEEKGSIVKGSEKGLVNIAPNNYKTLLDFSYKLYTDLGEPIQLEFVQEVDTEKLFIVQMRVLGNIASKSRSKDITSLEKTISTDIVVRCNSFSKGVLREVLVKDIYILKKGEDLPSEKLLRKKALLVNSGNTFSHALALTARFKLPSCINFPLTTRELENMDIEKISIDTRLRDAIIILHKKSHRKK